MLVKTKGIVLHTLQYGESSLIVTFFSEDFGRVSCLVNATRGIRARNKASIIQPLFILELEMYLKKSRELQRIKEIRLFRPYLTIPFDIRKSSQVLFLAELLNKVIREEEPNCALYSFIENSLIFFDSMKEGAANFHLWFLAGFTEFAGIYPHLGEIRQGWFDMKKGMITGSVPLHPFFMDQEVTACFKDIINRNIHELPGVIISHSTRNDLLNKILEYYHQHFGNLENFNSLAVLHEVFQRRIT
jgi:DNA repair protein RecO (recombination protein O)